MSSYNELNSRARKLIDQVADGIDLGVGLFSNENMLKESEQVYKKCRRICRLVKIVVFGVCTAIIYFHLKG